MTNNTKANSTRAIRYTKITIIRKRKIFRRNVISSNYLVLINQENVITAQEEGEVKCSRRTTEAHSIELTHKITDTRPMNQENRLCKTIIFQP